MTSSYQKLDRAAFISYHKRKSNRRHSPWNFILILLWIGSMATFTAVIRTHRFAFLEDTPLGLTIFAALFFPPAAGLTWAALRHFDKQYERCPACSASIQTPHPQAIIATGNCGICGETILKD